jgi:hypothetical protein
MTAAAAVAADLGRAFEQLQVMRPENVAARLEAQGFVVTSQVDVSEGRT